MSDDFRHCISCLISPVPPKPCLFIRCSLSSLMLISGPTRGVQLHHARAHGRRRTGEYAHEHSGMQQHPPMVSSLLIPAILVYVSPHRTLMKCSSHHPPSPSHLVCIGFYYPKLLSEQCRGSDFDYLCLPGSSRNSSLHVAARASGRFSPASLLCMTTRPFILQA